MCDYDYMVDFYRLGYIFPKFTLMFSSQDIPSLHVVSYIGCGISIVCLTVTIGAILLFRCTCVVILFVYNVTCLYQMHFILYIYIYHYRKTAFKGTHNKIHLNLSIALLFGLIVFVSGIESAKNDRVCISTFICL